MADKDRKSPTEEIIDQCVKKLQDERAVQVAEHKAAKVICDMKEQVENYKLCCLSKSRDVWDLYTNLDLSYVVTSNKSVVLLNENLKKYCDKQTELVTKLKEAVKTLKETKGKLSEVVDEACKIDRCVKEEKRCKKGLHEQLKNSKGEFSECLEGIEKWSTRCFNIACKAFDAGVDVVGIQTFIDLESLKVLGADLTTKMTTLKTDVSGNAEVAYGEWVKSKSELITIKEELVTGKYGKCASRNKREGIDETIGFLCDPNACQDLKGHDLEAICKCVKDNYGHDPEHEPEEEPEKPRHPGKKPPKKDEDGGEWELD